MSIRSHSPVDSTSTNGEDGNDGNDAVVIVIGNTIFQANTFLSRIVSISNECHYGSQSSEVNGKHERKALCQKENVFHSTFIYSLQWFYLAAGHSDAHLVS